MHMHAGLDLNGKPVAVFGLGDSVSYGEYFCDAMEEVYRWVAECLAFHLWLLCRSASQVVVSSENWTQTCTRAPSRDSDTRHC